LNIGMGLLNRQTIYHAVPTRSLTEPHLLVEA
jgi:hypothetical protein